MKITKQKQRGFLRFPIGKRRGRPIPSGGGGGGGAVGTGIRGAINLPGVDPFIGAFPYTDLMKSTNSLWTSTDFPGGMPRTDSRLNSNHFPTAVPAGASVTLLIFLGLQNLRSTTKVKAGTYKVTWTPVNGASISVSGTGVSSVVSGTAGVATFTLSGTASDLFLTVTGIGSAGGGNNIRIFHTDHEIALDAGDPLHPDFVSQVQSWPSLRSVRFLDFLNTNSSTVTTAADWTSLSYQSYCRSDRGCPPEILGMLGAKLPSTVGLWTTMPRTANDAAKAAMFQKIKAQEPSGTRMIYCEGINEAWNSGFSAYTQLGTVDYIGLDVRDINGNASTAFNDRLTAAYMQHAFRTWLACEAEFGLTRTTRIVGVQTDFYAFMAPWIHYRDTTGLNSYGGATALTLMNPGSGRPDGEMCFTWYFYAYNGSSIKQRIREDLGGQSDDAVKAVWLNDIDNNRRNNIVPQCHNYRDRGYLGKFGTYEGHCHDFWDRNETAAGQEANFSGTVNTGTNTVNFPVDTTDWLSDGDQLVVPNQTMISALTFPYFFYVRKTGTNSIRCYATLSAYNADSGNTGAGAATLLAGTFLFANQTRHAKMSDKMSSIFKGQVGAEIFRYVVETVLRHPSVQATSVNLFVALSSDRTVDQRFVHSFDSANTGMYGADTPAITYLKSLSGVTANWPNAVIRAATASYADVTAAITACPLGGSVVIPASAGVSWASGITVSGINIVGAGKSTSGTIVTAGTITVTKHPTYKTRVSGLRFTANAQHIAVGGVAADKFYYIDNCYFANNGAVVASVGTNGGLWFGCDFVAATPHSADVFQLSLGNTAAAASSWAAAPTMGADDTTGEVNNYFEECNWSGFLEVAGDIDDGAKAVYRRNIFTDSSLVVHGGNQGVNDTSTYGGRHLEVYDNTFVRVSNAVGVNKWVWWRGSSGVFANNVVAEAGSPDGSSFPNKPEILLSCGCTSSPTYPMQRQVGQATDTADATPDKPIAIFGNTGAGASSGNFIVVSGVSGGGITCGLPGTYIQSGRDYVLSNTWGWTAKAYPHPSRAGL